MTTYNGYKFMSLHDALSQEPQDEPHPDLVVGMAALATTTGAISVTDADDAKATEAAMEQLLIHQITDYVDIVEEVGQYLEAQIRLRRASAEEVTIFFSKYATAATKGDDFEIMENAYSSGTSYDVFYIRDLEMEEISAIALVRHELELSHVDIYTDGLEEYDLEYDDDIIALGDYVDILIKFLRFVLTHILSAHRPENKPKIVFDFHNPDMYQHLTARSPIAAFSGNAEDISIDLRCPQRK